MEDFKDAKYESKPSGHILINGQEVAHTMQCKHCGEHFISRKGSGKKRGWCFRCFGVTCGKNYCMPCIPFMVKIEWAEALDQLKKDALSINAAKKISEIEFRYPEIKKFKVIF